MNNLVIGLIQTTLFWESPEQNRRHFEAKMKQADNADLIVLPEMFSTGFSMASEANAESMQGDTISWLATQSTLLDTAICGSVMVREGPHYFNRFVLTRPSQPPVHYDKRHLFRMADEHHHYSAGTERVVAELKSFRLCPQVCYDLRFPVFSRNNNDYDVLLYVANWPEARRSQWRTLLSARAIENQAYVVAVNRIGVDGNNVRYAGDSGVVGPDGVWLEDLQDRDAYRQVEINLESLRTFRREFPAWQDADGFSLDEH